jgi:RHS repeat-associated protein
MLVCKYSYSAYGIVSITMDTGGIGALNPIRYKGYYYDNERQLYCISNIYYSPTLARFIQPIDISNLNTSNINGLNLYSYANNNPIHKADKNPIFSSLLKFEQNKLQNDFVSEIHYKSKFFVLEKFDFFVFDKKKVALIDG